MTYLTSEEYKTFFNDSAPLANYERLEELAVDKLEEISFAFPTIEEFNLMEEYPKRMLTKAIFFQVRYCNNNYESLTNEIEETGIKQVSIGAFSYTKGDANNSSSEESKFNSSKNLSSQALMYLRKSGIIKEAL